jgi:hypothetical protein
MAFRNRRRWRKSQAERAATFARRPLQFEPLEHRRLLAITVDTILDAVDASDGFTSLREAVAAANATTAADTIDFAPSLTASGPATIVLTHGQLLVTRTLTIDGPGSPLLTIDVSGSDATPDVHNGDGSRIFDLAPQFVTASLSMSGLRLVGGDHTGFGGVLQAKGNVSLDDVIAEDNHSLNGGALFVMGDVTVANSIFRNNVSESAGGALAVQGDLTVTNSSLTHNVAIAAHGGAIDNWDGDLFVDKCDLSYNTATDGGAIQTGVTRFELRNSTLTHNRAVGGNRGGGAILTGELFGNQVIITSSTISDNESIVVNSPQPNRSGGGGILSLARGTHTITDTVIRNNKVTGLAGANGGGVAIGANSSPTFQLSGSVVEGNEAEGRGGGLYFTQFLAGVNIADSAIRENTAVDRGGGIYTSFLTLERSVVAENHTAGAAARGGGIFSTTVAIADSFISGNYTLGENARGGGIYATTTNNTAEPIVRSTISSNYTMGASADGGGVYFSQRFSLVESTLSGNRTFGELARGGGAYTRDIVATRSTIASNSVSGGAATGGGIYAWGSVSLEGCIVALNKDAGSPSDITSTTTIQAFHSLVGDTTGINSGGGPPVGGSGNVLNQHPRLGPLAYNGGRVFLDESGILTHALLVGSPAIDMGRPGTAGSVLYDQRGVPFGRVVDGDAVVGARIDMGAYERQPGEVFTLVVDTLVDENDGDYSAGDFSLREAIAIANANPGSDTIEFAAELTAAGPATILLVQGELVITDSVLITGPGEHLLTIDAKGNDPTPTPNDGDGSRIFRIDDGLESAQIDVSLANMRLTGGNASVDGGAILNLENLSIQRMRIEGNSALGRGGGIFSEAGRFKVEASTISSNRAQLAGGGIWLSSSLSGSRIDSSLLASNLSFANGGGVAVTGEEELLVINSTFLSNISVAGGDELDLRSSAGTVSVVHSTIASSIGGIGVFALERQSLANTIVSTRQGTTADLVGEFDVNYSLIFQVGSAVIHGSNNVFGQLPRYTEAADFGGPTRMLGLAENSPAVNAGDPSAIAGGDGIPEFDQRSGYGRVFGGRIDIGAFERQDVGIAQTYIVDTIADELDGDYSAGDLSLREAIALANGNSGYDDRIVYHENLGDSVVILLSQGRLQIADELTIDGGDRPTKVTIDASGNDPTPGVFDGEGSQIFRFGGGDAANHPLSLTLIGLRLTGADYDSDGGAIETRESLFVHDSVFEGNSARNGGTIDLNALGAVTVEIVRTAFRNNLADADGGAIRIAMQGGNATIVDVEISGNRARSDGGGMRLDLNDAADARIERTLIQMNRAGLMPNDSGSGGGLYVDVDTTSRFVLNHSSVSGNRVNGTSVSGGGVALMNRGNALIENALIQQNEVADSSVTSPIGFGGGLNIYNGSGGTFILAGTTVAENRANGDGGGMILRARANSLISSIQNSTFSANSADGSGGGLQIRNVSGPGQPFIEVLHSTITGNTSDADEDGDGEGGGIYAGDIQFFLSHTIIAGNIDPSNGAPDLLFIPVGGGITARSNLVGTNAKSSLDEAPIGTPDADGNLIGGPIHGVFQANLGPLTYNGGPIFLDGSGMLTHALLPGSPAIDGGNPTEMAGTNGIPNFDQRGEPWSRVAGGRIDIGAFEVQTNPLPGDYSFNGVVDAADYVVWRNTVGSPDDLRADGSGPTFGVPDGVVDDLDRVFWKKNFGNVYSEQGAGGSGQGVKASAGAASLHDSRDEALPRTTEAEGFLGILGGGSSFVGGVESRQAVRRENATMEVREDALLAWVSGRQSDGAASQDEAGIDELASEAADSDRDAASIDDVFELLGAANNW